MKKNKKNIKNTEKVEVKETNVINKDTTKVKPQVKKIQKNPVVQIEKNISKDIEEISKVNVVTKVPFYKRWFLLKSIYEGFKRWFIK